mgnify:CR=1 FL=1
MNIRAISRSLGIVLIINAIMMFLSAGVAALNNFDTSFSPLILSALITFTVGLFPLIFVRERNQMKLIEGYIVVFLGWLISVIFGMLPFVMWGGDFTLVNAWFECCSGYTTTGATILTDVESLPKGLLLWRSSTHFLGGIGVVVFILLLIPTLKNNYTQISNTDISDVSKDYYSKRTTKIINVRLYIYLGLNILMILALLLAGLPLFDAVNTSFSTIATGGFHIKNASIAAYDSFLIETIVSIFTIFGSLHFGLLYLSLVNRKAKILSSNVTKFFLRFVLISALIISITLFIEGNYDTIWSSLRHGFFQTITIVSTTGFATADTSQWPVLTIFILLLLMLLGGCSGSTAGGLKADRLAIVIASVKASIKKQAHQNAVIPVKLGKDIISSKLVNSVLTFTALYIALLILFMFIYALCGIPMLESCTGSLALMSNVGPSFGVIGSVGNYAEIPSIAKFIMGIQMIIGRIEIYPLLIIITLLYKRK